MVLVSVSCGGSNRSAAGAVAGSQASAGGDPDALDLREIFEEGAPREVVQTCKVARRKAVAGKEFVAVSFPDLGGASFVLPESADWKFHCDEDTLFWAVSPRLREQVSLVEGDRASIDDKSHFDVFMERMTDGYRRYGVRVLDQNVVLLPADKWPSPPAFAQVQLDSPDGKKLRGFPQHSFWSSRLVSEKGTRYDLHVTHYPRGGASDKGAWESVIYSLVSYLQGRDNPDPLAPTPSEVEARRERMRQVQEKLRSRSAAVSRAAAESAERERTKSVKDKNGKGSAGF